ncbi:Cif family virulence factor [Maribacter flavus]|uniref:Calcium/calmodulin-dependent protein kinase II association-domain domain-containing protein n=1 Tax=Maribacter flavus TaxID=1658664 RepID=A0A5B2TRS1_9FLAO|nr:hypothetical protein [Maribacter flavus]KAA2217266.1 hypothetical protein F0361_15035 [Maribacter flavus]
MIKNRLFINLVLMLSVAATYANTTANTLVGTMKISNDSLRIAELDTFWAEVSRTVREGDFEGYKATYHEDAVVVFTTRENKSSISITKALSNWKQDFIDTKAGKTKNTVEFRFSQRVGDENTAHETGIFGFQSNDGSGKTAPKQFVHFEALLVKKDNGWLMVMEYQKSKATEEEWALLE